MAKLIERCAWNRSSIIYAWFGTVVENFEGSCALCSGQIP